MIIRFVKYIDRTVLGRHQAISDWTQENVGWTNFDLARFCLWLLIGAATFIAVVYMHLVDGSVYAGFKESAVAAITFAILCIAGFFFCKKVEIECDRDLVKSGINKRTRSLRGIRLLLFGIAINHIIYFSIVASMVMQVQLYQLAIGKLVAVCVCSTGIIIGFVLSSFFYFLSCTPLPPCKSKLEIWLNSKKKKEVFA